MKSRYAAIAVLAVLARVAPACSDGAGSAESAAPPAVAPSTIAVSARPSATVAVPAAAPASSLAGRWRGSFDAKKAVVALDPGVKEAAWSADDGKTHAGKCELDLVVTADGEVRGTLRGALGNAAVAGLVDGDALTSTFAPTDESGAGLSGVIVLQRKDAKLVGDLKASSGDATVVRAGALELARFDGGAADGQAPPVDR